MSEHDWRRDAFSDNRRKCSACGCVEMEFSRNLASEHRGRVRWSTSITIRAANRSLA